MKKSLIALILIVFVGLLLRSSFLNISPPGFNADEAALGYNAYSLLKTGKDEWGSSFPLVFKSFSDYKPGGYIYLAMPFVAIFGLNEFSTRLPSIILGTLSIWLIYLVSKRIFKDEVIALSTAFLLSISPWHIHFSRGAWETNVATFFILLGVYGFIRGLENYRWFFVPATAFIMSMYTYQSPRLLIPLFALGLAAVYWKKIFTKKIIYVVIFGIALLIPLIFVTVTNKGLARFQGISFFTDVGIEVRMNQDRGEHSGPNTILGRVYHNKPVSFGLSFLGHYFDHFDPNFLFIKGDSLKRNNVPEMGQLYLFEFITIALGLFYLFSRKNPLTWIILIWLGIAPIASSMTYQTPSALRAENMVIPLILISGVGLGLLINLLSVQRSIVKYGALGLGSILIMFFVLKFIHQYFIHLPKQNALEWQYGFSKLVPKIFDQKDQYDKTIITTRYDQPYILFLFYSKYDPLKFQQTAKSTPPDKFGFSTIESFDKFEFRAINQEEIGKIKNLLYVGSADEINQKKLDDVIYYPNSKEAFKIVGTK